MPQEQNNSRIVCVSGAFDILHLGHIRLFEGARHFGDKLVVILNSDRWLQEHHGRVIMSWPERKHMLSAIKGIDDIVPVDDSDGTVCEAIKRIMPFAFANGGNRWQDNTPERQLCRELGIVTLYGIGGGMEEDYMEKIKLALKNHEEKEI